MTTNERYSMLGLLMKHGNLDALLAEIVFFRRELKTSKNIIKYHETSDWEVSSLG